MKGDPLGPRLGPEAHINRGPVVTPRQAATVIVLRGASEGLEVLLVKRTPEARFMGGVWVFPGGSVDDTEGDGDRSHRAAAVRELREETGIELANPEILVKFSRWITPAEVTIRFDTHFYLAPMPDGQEPIVDGAEIVDHRWFTPADALTANDGGEIVLVFPTIKHLEQLRPFASADELLAYARGRTVEAVQPRVVMRRDPEQEGEVARIVLPGEPGYETEAREDPGGRH